MVLQSGLPGKMANWKLWGNGWLTVVWEIKIQRTLFLYSISNFPNSKISPNQQTSTIRSTNFLATRLDFLLCQKPVPPSQCFGPEQTGWKAPFKNLQKRFEWGFHSRDYPWLLPGPPSTCRQERWASYKDYVKALCFLFFFYLFIY